MCVWDLILVLVEFHLVTVFSSLFSFVGFGFLYNTHTHTHACMSTMYFVYKSSFVHTFTLCFFLYSFGLFMQSTQSDNSLYTFHTRFTFCSCEIVDEDKTHSFVHTNVRFRYSNGLINTWMNAFYELGILAQCYIAPDAIKSDFRKFMLKVL